MIPQPPQRRLARRLLAANGLVIAAGAVTLGVVSFIVGPPLFRRHVARALGPVTDTVGQHLDQALSSALFLSLGLGTAAAVAGALAVSWILSSRLARPIDELADAAERLASGDLSARAVVPPTDDELADLTKTFNGMAASLEHIEDTRRQLLSDLAHELRTPLSTVEGYHEGLADGVVPPDEPTWETLRDATTRMRRLIDDVALVSRAEEGQLGLAPEPVRVSSLIERATRSAREEYDRKGVVLETPAIDRDPEVVVDRDRATQILTNLLDNAHKHTAPGGHVRVTATSQGGRVAVTVRDDGEGIDAAHLPHVFERFYRGDAARRSGSGSGIGLTIARALARAHGGDLTAASDGPGAGATFTWTIAARAVAEPDPRS